VSVLQLLRRFGLGNGRRFARGRPAEEGINQAPKRVALQNWKMELNVLAESREIAV
jgi:hypothetical protein